jgi:hypothetical protein
VDCCLPCFLIAGAMPSLYSRLRGFVHPYFGAMTPLIMIRNSVNEVLKLYRS